MSGSPTPQRADARRNRERLLAAARDAFTAPDAAPSLEGVARAAGVGIGTLYRHFPTRDALVEALYRNELEQVCASADELLATLPADRALRAWMDRYADFVRTKHGMAGVLGGVLATQSATGATRAAVNDAVAALLAAGTADGTLRADVPADDVTSGLVGVFLATAGTDRETQAARLLDLLLAGLRPH